ncbi:hypothetical protein SAMN00790413_04813 [Deinococcus hopiensis KR-140]|uniref:Transposase DDE domain-containing protein n=1 Tax=Deinococcus hopiensis KR-140 TaxID=695939 RepID=A0A1W1ULQ3_9DEIO|nr:hypothetical protein SAMN00790413_04813 [Deinococcus hopiensis KR-140]
MWASCRGFHTLLCGALFVVSRAQYAQSYERRFLRALSSTTSPWRSIYQHVLRVALKDWDDARITLALDTTLLFKRWCVIGVSLVDRGRALPLAWRVLRHGSSMVSNKEIYPVLARVQCLPTHLSQVEDALHPCRPRIFRPSVDGRFLCLRLALEHLRQRAGVPLRCCWALPWRVPRAVKSTWSLGRAARRLHHSAALWTREYRRDLAVWPERPWFIAHDEPCSTRTFAEYHQRTQIEEGFLDLKSAVLNLEDTRLGQTHQLERLLFVMGPAYVMLLSEGTAVVAVRERRTVDTHWQRGLSYAQLGCRAIRRALMERSPFLQRLRLSPNPDPQPSRRRCSPLRWHLIQGFS